MDSMYDRIRAAIVAIACVCLLAGTPTACSHIKRAAYPSPAESGLNTRDLIDPLAQSEADELNPTSQLAAAGERIRKDRQQKLTEQSKNEGGVSATQPNRNILCLSGGGSYGAYTVGVLIGWSERGDRPSFDVVTGISTGALIAPSVFLGPKYDAKLKQLYTTAVTKDIYTVRRFWGLFDESYADTAPMAARIDAFVDAELMRDLAEAHRQGRRLYIGTTEEEGKQFVIWDIGAIAERNGPKDRELIVKVMLASSAAPGYFPAIKIDVNVDGTWHTERHVDGGVSQALFYRPPYVAPQERSNVAGRDLAGAKVYVIVAGKLYADPEVIRPWSLSSAGTNVSTLLYAQARGDLQRLYTVCLLTGMDYYLSAIPPEYVIASSIVEFDPKRMTALFEEGRRVILSAKPWRVLPPGIKEGESALTRLGPNLTYQRRGPQLPITGPKGVSIPPRFPVPNSDGIQAVAPAPIIK